MCPAGPAASMVTYILRYNHNSYERFILTFSAAGYSTFTIYIRGL
jgi:hypothetical protein